MPYKKQEDINKYHKQYYHNHNLRQKQTDRKRLRYWRKKYVKTFACLESECKQFTEMELREQIESGMCKV